MFKKNTLSAGVAAVVWGLVVSLPLHAQESAAEDKQKVNSEERRKESDNKSEKELVVTVPENSVEMIEVTGSLIPRNSFDGPDPITVIDAEDMKAMGLTTVAEVIDSLTENSGATEGGQGALTSGFTIGASEANLRGLGTGRTLVLVNGRRIADYPLPFGGEQNGADLGAIPISALARVEVLSGGASATYGSDAVGGVINLITVRDMERTSLTVNTGVYEEGYGYFNQTSFITGTVFDKGSVTMNLEHSSSQPVFQDQVSFMDDKPFVVTGTRVLRQDVTNLEGNGPVSPAGFNCDARGMMASETFSEDGATICNFDASGGNALANEFDRTSLFLDGRYELSDNLRGFATVLASKQEVGSSRTSVGLLQTNIMNADANKLLTVDRSFVPDLGFAKTSVNQEMWTLMTGLQGEVFLGDDAWNWDVSYSKARYQIEQGTNELREEVMREWLMDGSGGYNQLGENFYQVSNDFFENGLVDNIFRDASVDRDALVGTATTHGASSAQTLTAKVVGELSDFGVLYNPVTLAVAFDWSSQDSQISPDERLLNTSGSGWYGRNAITSGGNRDRKAIGAEFLVPVVEDLELTLATRLDRYDDSTAIGGRATSAAKFVYQPLDAVKFRGHYSQTFRAPDMFAIYGESKGNANVIDLSVGNCFDGESYSCPMTSAAYIRRGRTDLEEEKGDDLGLGLVFTPTDNISASVDWYKVKLENLVSIEQQFDLIQNEWFCENGDYDIGSRFCQDVLDKVVRNANGQIEMVILEPQNEEFRELEGVDVRLAARFESTRYGLFGVGLNYSNILSHDWLRFAGDEPVDVTEGLAGQSTPKTNSNLTLSWSNPLSAFQSIGGSLFIQRQGSVDNFARNKELEPFYTLNLRGRYQASARLGIGLRVNNLTNAKPIEDQSNPYWPNYWQHLQSPLGRSFALEVNYFLSD